MKVWEVGGCVLVQQPNAGCLRRNKMQVVCAATNCSLFAPHMGGFKVKPAWFA
jgi:hypothetical protein